MTTINSTELTVDDAHIVIGSIDTETSALNGIILRGSTDKSLLMEVMEFIRTF